MRPASFFARLAFARARVLACVFIVCGAIAAPASAYASTVEAFAIPSAALGRPLDVSVYRPDGAPPAAGWPVLYLLHGLHGCFRDWASLGGVQKTLDRLIASGRIKPMLVVMPDGANSWYVDSAAIGGPGNYQTAMLDDLPNAIERLLPAQRERGGRAIAGLSMGGFGALRLALTRPDRYVAVASLSGAIWQNAPSAGLDRGAIRDADGGYFRRVDAATVVSGIDAPPAGDHFGAAFGVPFDARRFNAANVFTLLAQQLRAGAELPAIYLTVGDHDSHDLWRGSIAFYETLMADGVDVDFRVTGGDHVWALWRQSIEDALVFVDSKFNDAQPGKIAVGLPTPKFAGAAATIK
ncbi:alpha/beta hydrolase family protein [Methylocapsa sp. S129]|uniref:alpha/beta hydrolase n=1 Tax=Methylocapsa sp. S129 TaxID=1641869 RepID=UPI00131BF1D4|nr:alpha/beta hydrolase family protein [Methylocapsa sp. S129]